MSNESQRSKIDEALRAVRAVGPAQCGVLVVEDDPDLQWQLARMLTIEGNRVVGTSSGDGALALIGEWPVDLVLVDEDLPKMTGLEVVRRIKRAHPNVPVVLMTGDETPEMSAAARLAGVVGCLIKPFQLETLTSLLTELAFGDALADPAE